MLVTHWHSFFCFCEEGEWRMCKLANCWLVCIKKTEAWDKLDCVLSRIFELIINFLSVLPHYTLTNAVYFNETGKVADLKDANIYTLFQPEWLCLDTGNLQKCLLYRTLSKERWSPTTTRPKSTVVLETFNMTEIASLMNDKHSGDFESFLVVSHLWSITPSICDVGPVDPKGIPWGVLWEHEQIKDEWSFITRFGNKNHTSKTSHFHSKVFKLSQLTQFPHTSHLNPLSCSLFCPFLSHFACLNAGTSRAGVGK